jgi:hypothetical protein
VEGRVKRERVSEIEEIVRSILALFPLSDHPSLTMK